MQEEEIRDYLRHNIEPFAFSFSEVSFRAAVHLTDGLFLPCVVFRNQEERVKQAIKRFRDEQTGRSIYKDPTNGYEEIVKSFVTRGNRLSFSDIASIEPSQFAFPAYVLNQIVGETTMSWTGFVAKMKDGKLFGFGTEFRFEFFDMPENYSVQDIEEIINHSYILKSGELCLLQEGCRSFPDNYEDAVIYRERTFFNCYIEGL